MQTLDQSSESQAGAGAPAVLVDPPCRVWPALIKRRPAGDLLGKRVEEWRELSRAELKLDTSRAIIATGHQTLLWHPGILAKYLVVNAFVQQHKLATANLIVDQHAEGFGDFEAPVRRDDGSLAVRKIELCRPRPRKDVPMGRHESFTPPRPPENIVGAIPSVNDGINRIFEAVYAHRNAPNAALQMADALAELMSHWVLPMRNVTSTNLISTTLARAIMRAMVDDPTRCAECYNRAVAAVPEGGLHPLMIRDDYVELPLWRIRPDGRRMHAYDSDVSKALELEITSATESPLVIDLLPRALFMTALVRLCMCDLFIHGTGGARYDRAMEIWIDDWLGVDVGSIAVATADLRLPLIAESKIHPDLHQAIQRARRAFHDPEMQQRTPGPRKRRWLEHINALSRGDGERRTTFLDMHRDLESMRRSNPTVSVALKEVERARMGAADAQVAQRRDWAFPLYPRHMIDDLANRMCECASAST